jgi:hypothetical protein
MGKNILIASITGALALATISSAEEGGSGHYLPGTMASFIDAFPGKPDSLAVLNYFTFYGASAGASRSLPLGGFLTAGVDANVYADTLVGFYQTPWQVLGGGYAVGLAVPYVWMEIEGQAQRIGPGGVPGAVVAVRDTANGIGDITVFPFMLGWTNVPDLKYDLRLGIYAPSGGYKVGQLANVGKNYWTFEPGVMASWLSSKIGTEVSLYTALDFNTRNDDTDYQTGTQFHLDGTIAQHLPFAGGFIGIGANGFFYQQISGDSGSGARLGDFEGRTTGVGSVLSYARKIGGKADLVAEVKWLPEIETKNRLHGDYIWFKVALVF